ncbi:MAG: asparaginase [Ignavibacteriae bacterium]|nr:asparaginase [Ignavibacteriota bacterium]
MKILFIQTGGTIDKDYPRQTKGYAFEISEPAVRQILERANPSFEYDIIPLLRKDSLDLTVKDKKKIFEECEKVDTDKIIITHGTDTIIDTAAFLSELKNKTIILTGAFKPEKFTNTDADFNVGSAVGAVNVLGYGVYIAMNGNIFRYDEVRRDKVTGKFISN